MNKEQKHRLTKSERTVRKEKIVSFICLFIVSLFFAFPLIYMIGASFKTSADLQLHPEKIFPSAGEWTLDNFAGFLWRDGAIDNMPIWMFNSLWSAFATVGLTVLLDLVTAYAVVFMEFKGKKILMKFLLLWMAVPGVIGTAPSFAMYASIRNSLHISSDIANYLYIYMWIILPGVTGIFNMLLMRNFFESIPKDIVDSAKSDGAKNRAIFFKIVVPLAKSTIMLIVLFTFIGAWNNLIWPQLLFSGENSYWNTVTIFIITQNKMIDGLASTGVKM